MSRDGGGSAGPARLRERVPRPTSRALAVALLLLATATAVPVGTGSAAGLMAHGNDLILYDIETKSTICLVEDQSRIDRIPYSISNEYVVWGLNGLSINIKNLSNKSSITYYLPEGYAKSMTIYKSQIYYNNASSIYMYDINTEKTEKIIESDASISNIETIQANGDNLVVVNYNKVNNSWKYHNKIYYINLSGEEKLIPHLIDSEDYKEIQAILFENWVLYLGYIDGKYTINLFDIVSNNITEIYEADMFIDIVAIEEDYLAWRLENGTVVFQDRNNGRIWYGFGTGRRIYEYSADNGRIVFDDWDTEEVYLYNSTNDKTIRITDTSNKGEYLPIIKGSYIVWGVWHYDRLAEFLWHYGCYLPFLLIPIILIGVVIIFIRGKYRSNIGFQPPFPPPPP